MSEKTSIPPRAYSYVRMSTAIQLKGDSRRRQMERSRKYADDKGLYLVEDLKLHDIGKSAFRGDNIRGGALGKFLAAVNKGEIPEGSYLLVESLDRITRQEIVKAQTLFLQIVSSGINVVTLIDGHVYEAGKINIYDLFMSLISLSTAHEESAKKSDRLKSSWAEKRRQAATKKITGVCPAWLHLSANSKVFDVIEDRAAVVRSIYEDSAAGIGDHSITRRLNELGVSPFGKSNGWQKSYVSKILTTRAVLGEFQPHRTGQAGKRVPVGEVIAGYYPAIVPEELFIRAWHARIGRRETGRGRKGKGITSLFSGLLKCAYCGGTMVLENKGQPPKGGLYLVCEKAKRGLDCSKVRWRYKDFEASFLGFIQEVDLKELMAPEVSNQPLAKMIATERARIASLEEKREALIQLIGRVKHKERLGSELDTIEEGLIELRTNLTNHERDQLGLAAAAKQFAEGQGQIKSLVEKLQNVDGIEDMYLVRARTSGRIKNLVDKVILGADGSLPEVRKIIVEEQQNATPDHQFIADLEFALTGDRTKQPYFTVMFKDGTIRIIAPSKNDPLQLIIRGDGSAGSITRTAPDGTTTVSETTEDEHRKLAIFGH